MYRRLVRTSGMGQALSQFDVNLPGAPTGYEVNIPGTTSAPPAPTFWQGLTNTLEQIIPPALQTTQQFFKLKTDIAARQRAEAETDYLRLIGLGPGGVSDIPMWVWIAGGGVGLILILSLVGGKR